MSFENGSHFVIMNVSFIDEAIKRIVATWIWVNIGSGNDSSTDGISHYLNHCWIIISNIQWHSSEGNLTNMRRVNRVYVYYVEHINRVNVATEMYTLYIGRYTQVLW